MLNRITLVGHIGKDPVCKQTTAGRPMVTFSMVTRERTRDGERTDWHQVVTFDQHAASLTSMAQSKGEGVSPLFRGGVLVYVEGALRTDISGGKDGKPKTYFQRVYATRVVLLGPNFGPIGEEPELPKTESNGEGA